MDSLLPFGGAGFSWYIYAEEAHMSIYTMSDELLALARTDVIRRLESVLRIEGELTHKLAEYDTEVARRQRFAAPPWDDGATLEDVDPRDDYLGRERGAFVVPEDFGPIDTLEERVE
jgi:hypothetical protein